MEGPIVKVRKLDLLNLHRLLNGAAVKVRHMMSEAELKEFSETCLTRGLESDKRTSQD